jgi:hypothetical protein
MHINDMNFDMLDLIEIHYHYYFPLCMSYVILIFLDLFLVNVIPLVYIPHRHMQYI